MKKRNKTALVAIGAVSAIVLGVLGIQTLRDFLVLKRVDGIPSEGLRAECLKQHIDKRARFSLGFNPKSGNLDLRC